MNMRFVTSLLAMSLTALMVSSAYAQDDAAKDFPKKPIRLIVGFTAGGGNDILARLVGQKLTESLGQPIVVENKPGAGSIIAAEYVAKATPDGYTLMMGASGAMSINPAVYEKLPYSSQRDFVPISMVASFPLVLLVNPSVPVHSVEELVAYARANPDKANYSGSSAAFQLATELFKMRTGAPLQYVAYKGSSDSITAVISGEVLMTFVDAGPASRQLEGNRLRGLAVTSPRRSPSLPDLPTLAEAGVPDVQVVLWSGIFAPAGTPPPVVKKLQDEVMRIVRLPDIAERMKTLALDPVGNTSEEFSRVIAAEIATWTAVAKASNIKIVQ